MGPYQGVRNERWFPVLMFDSLLGGLHDSFKSGLRAPGLDVMYLLRGTAPSHLLSNVPIACFYFQRTGFSWLTKPLSRINEMQIDLKNFPKVLTELLSSLPLILNSL